MDYKNNINFRKQSLIKLLYTIKLYENEITEALYKDFKKPAFETFVTETNIVLDDLKYTINNINSWAKPKKVLPSFLNFPSKEYIYSEPYGNTLIISPWNYPFQLALCPLIAAVAAGNKVTLKPSELTPNTSSLISKIIRETFDPKHVIAVLGDARLSEELLKKRWDYIFFTGSVAVGKIVYKAAAEYLTPVTLELGGKNPCIIDDTANLDLATKRIVWGKFINAGQTCIAPDYLLVKQSIKNKFISLLKKEIINAYGENPEQSPDFARIINKDHWKRLMGLMEFQDIAFGGSHNEDENYLSPTLIDEPNLESAVMKDEIFGPILPILSYNSNDDLKRIISKSEKPLSLYVFTEDNAFAEKIIQQYSFGGGCVNDTVVHFSNRRLPFGGVGNSGIGAYHGKLSFDTFSHKKAIVKKANWLDIPFRYAPYKNKLKSIKKILKWI
ncbi:aldehyde dehydrogenase (NAD+) [Flavobacterium arsenatis]|uniref:Aldehyde dehydrogenase n=1 Tax=Flavobacterium arsenatis TaxID=1484332 RepID=A0ABU1TTZ5_9FLAO|nr:aldehyde dehydrogenase [Flavobacterium arsenatis]MDR6969357.1 aldehyde dehydrogenase (NAD+) [Flavobacterium arsenatis]